jgi:predicted amidohydrolase YtcJ
VKSRAAGQLDLETIAERILMDLEKAAVRGVTTVHDIVVNRDEVRAYQMLEQQGRLRVRVQILPRVIEFNFSKESLLNELDETVWRYHEMGMRCCVHAISDIALDIQCARWVGFQEKKVGTLEPGKLADVLVFGADDPFDYLAADFRCLPIDLTLVEGKIAYNQRVGRME